MLDYMLPRKVMSWKESFELYFEEQMLGGLFRDLAFYGIKPPRHVEDAIKEKEVLSHRVYWTLYQFSFAAGFTTSAPTDEHLDWLSQAYPDTFDKYYRPLWEKEKKNIENGGRHFARGLPQLCRVCRVPMLFTEPGEPNVLAQHESEFEGEIYHTCSNGCQWIFEREPEKYRRPGCPCTRSTGATAGVRPCRRSSTGTDCRTVTRVSTSARATTRTGWPGRARLRQRRAR
uniref:YHS domain-containing protein n=1 Tax=Janibacter limosus TaxID=53458 RepID=A0AC61U4F4_9MICO|nr:YHS domain-containing protein [Janibacter limosus]